MAIGGAWDRGRPLGCTLVVWGRDFWEVLGGFTSPRDAFPSTRHCERPVHADLPSRRLDSLTMLTADPRGQGPITDAQTALETSPPTGETWGPSDRSLRPCPAKPTLAKEAQTSSLISILSQPAWGTQQAWI